MKVNKIFGIVVLSRSCKKKKGKENGLDPKDVLVDMVAAFWDDAPALSTVQRRGS